MKERIIDRVKKLLSLSTSANEHEAKLAAQMATELLMKHNLSMREVETHQEFVEVKGKEWRSIPNDHLHILRIIRTYFSVEPVLSSVYDHAKQKKFRYVRFFGTKDNIDVATYVFEFLLRAARKSFNAKKKEGLYRDGDRPSFMHGFVHGMSLKLSETKKKVEATGAGLLVLHEAKLEEFVRSKLEGRYGSSKARVGRNQDAMNDGISTGKSLDITPGINESTKRLALGSGK